MGLDVDTAPGNQKPLKDVPLHLFELNQKVGDFSADIADGKLDGVVQIMSAMATPLANHIASQRERLGGDWAVSWVCNTKEERDVIRKLLGPDLHFIVLSVSRECQAQRLHLRHEGDVECAKELIAMFDEFL